MLWELTRSAGVVIAAKKSARNRNKYSEQTVSEIPVLPDYLLNDSYGGGYIHLDLLTSKQTGNKRAYEITGSSAFPDLTEQRSLTTAKYPLFTLRLSLPCCTIFLHRSKLDFSQNVKAEESKRYFCSSTSTEKYRLCQNKYFQVRFLSFPDNFFFWRKGSQVTFLPSEHEEHVA